MGTEDQLERMDVIADHLIWAPCVIGFIYSLWKYFQVSKIKITGHTGGDESTEDESDSDSSGSQTLPKRRGEGGGENLLVGDKEAKSDKEIAKLMDKISKIIADGAVQFLYAEYQIMAVYIVVFAIFLGVFTKEQYTAIAFVVGSVTSILAGYIGMKIAVFTNVRTAHECWDTLEKGFKVSIDGGCVMGISLVCIGVLDLFVLIVCFKPFFPIAAEPPNYSKRVEMFETIAGYGLGGSSIALFGRVGGGIYTKAADVGADLSGKNEYGLEEDDYRNPACIADNVGDNVGDIAGMGADLFGSFAESTCAALVLAASSAALSASDARGAATLKHWCSLMYPVLISSLGVVVGMLTLTINGFAFPVKKMPDVEKALKGILIISTVLMTPVVILLSKFCLPDGSFAVDSKHTAVDWTNCATSVLLGLWSGLIIGFVTEYYTSHSYTPVREIAETQKQSAATGIIYGLALGYLSCIIPVFCLGITILVAHRCCGMFGVALSALGMLGTMTMGLTIDAYGPISDNAGGIAEMCEMPPKVRGYTDCLDAAGNTTAAIGKGFAIGSAALVSLALFGAYCVRAKVTEVDILDAWVFTGLLFGAMLPYAFAALTMKSVGKAANEMVKECMKQFPKIMSGEAEPDYEKCIRISTQASLREMIAPGALVIGSPLVAGLGFGKNACAGLLSGALVSSVQLAISMSNTGGAWDNSKKYISAGYLEGHPKGSEAHKNSVTGDTVGDPLKDTSGPALNIVMKLTAILSLVFGAKIGEVYPNGYSNAKGGPWWLTE